MVRASSMSKPIDLDHGVLPAARAPLVLAAPVDLAGGPHVPPVEELVAA
eukprot:CAMPEP_0179269234 /NCGR_PEP_ID=MMETSP0797-20121207/30853_1 /TAXON_ID=47934 /ORGANISM="Dinophysis acuminata, Strain DAEP01" /LENGTH=48 /DNA_ID= /DNA_START= /DNA_END= /DNA_ORIENTATION=